MSSVAKFMGFVAFGFALAGTAQAATRTVVYQGACVAQPGEKYVIEVPGSCGLIQSCTILSATNTSAGCREVSECTEPYPSNILSQNCDSVGGAD
jgi:hypothetical protein